MTTLKTQLTDLLDREAIRDLPIRYCDGVWRGDVESLIELFDEEGAVITDKPVVSEVRGKDRLRDVFERLSADRQPRPFIHNHYVEKISPSQAVGRCYVELRLGNEEMTPWACGYYHDKYVKRNGVWLFLERRATLFEMIDRSSQFKV
jgi:hypothetical protein